MNENQKPEPAGMMQLSIIVPIYNTEKYLDRCLNTLLHQDLRPEEYEIIVINDGTKNYSAEIVEKYMAENPHISYIDPEIKGDFEIRNVGISHARGKYIYFVDSDDFIATQVMGKITSFMNQAELDVFGFGITNTSNSSLPTPAVEKSVQGIQIDDGPTFISKTNFSNESVWLVINREFLGLHNISYPPKAGFPKGVFTLQVIYNARRLAVIPDIIYADFQYPYPGVKQESPEQIRNFLMNYETTTDEFFNFWETIESDHTLSESGLERVKSKSIAYIFFMLIKALKSKLSLKEIRIILRRLRGKNYYPIRGFPGTDYRNKTTNFWLFVVNNKILFLFFIPIYRALTPLLKRFG